MKKVDINISDCTLKNVRSLSCKARKLENMAIASLIISSIICWTTVLAVPAYITKNEIEYINATALICYITSTIIAAMSFVLFIQSFCLAKRSKMIAKAIADLRQNLVPIHVNTLLSPAVVCKMGLDVDGETVYGSILKLKTTDGDDKNV